MSNQPSPPRGERPDPHPARALREAWWVCCPGGWWIPVVVQALAGPAKIYGPLPNWPEPLERFLAENPEALWLRLPWPEGRMRP